MNRRLLFTIISFFFCVYTYAQQVTAVVDRKEILIGEKIQLHLKGFFPADQPREWFRIDTIPHFEIMQRLKVDTQLVGTDVILTQTLILTSWDSGSQQLPAFRLSTGATQPIPIEVSYTPFDVRQPYNDIHDIVDVQPASSTTNWFWYFLGAILLIAILLLIFPPSDKKELPPTEIDPGAYAKAMKRIQELNESRLAEQDAKAYHSRLIDIFRGYVQARTGIYSFHKTTTDLAVQLQQLKIPAEAYRSLVQTLKLSDLVKFARYQPVRTENEDAQTTITKSIRAIEDVV